MEEIKEDITIDVLMYYAKNEQGVESSDADPYLFPCPVTVSNSTELRHNKITLKKKHTSQKSADALPVNVSGCVRCCSIFAVYLIFIACLLGFIMCTSSTATWMNLSLALPLKLMGTLCGKILMAIFLETNTT